MLISTNCGNSFWLPNALVYLCTTGVQFDFLSMIFLLMQVFILGYGNIGIELAKRLRPFGVKIIGTKRSWTSYAKDSCQFDGT